MATTTTPFERGRRRRRVAGRRRQIGRQLRNIRTYRAGCGRRSRRCAYAFAKRSFAARLEYYRATFVVSPVTTRADFTRRFLNVRIFFSIKCRTFATRRKQQFQAFAIRNIIASHCRLRFGHNCLPRHMLFNRVLITVPTVFFLIVAIERCVAAFRLLLDCPFLTSNRQQTTPSNLFGIP